jgi:hypothetical protein
MSMTHVGPTSTITYGEPILKTMLDYINFLLPISFYIIAKSLF